MAKANLGPVLVAATLFAATILVGSYELGQDRGTVVQANITAERHVGRTWHYATDASGEFAVVPIVGLLHGYPRVGDATEVRVHPDGSATWNAVTARYPFTVMAGILSFWTGIGLALAALRDPG